MHCTALSLVALALAASPEAKLAGKYVGHTDSGAVALTLRAQPDGRVTGTWTEDGADVPVSGRIEGRTLALTLAGPQGPVPFTAALAGDTLTVSAMGETVVLARAVAGAPPGRASRDGGASPDSGPLAAGPHPLRVVVNGVVLEPGRIEALQRQHGIRFASGEFWYDRRSGAWGLAGGPTAGAIAPGIAMGGALRRDASAGNTGVIVNGRELRIEEVLALQQLVPVYRGRYWIDAQANFGLEGGPAAGNLAAIAQARRAPRQGILSTWDRTGVAVFGP